MNGGKDADRWLLPIALAAVLAGIFFRFWDLGGAPLAVDEYFLGTSTLNTAARWLPEFACGGYYTRGVLIQYLSLPFVWLDVPLEFTVRFWPAVASLLSVLAAWRIGLLAGGRSVAAIAVILTSLSLWEVEFGRFGRMYSPFQAIFLWYLYFQARHLLRGDDTARWWYLALSGVAVLTFEGGAMLLALNFLPVVWRGRRSSVPHVVTALGLLAFGVAYNTVKFRPVATETTLETAAPQTEAAIGQSPVTLPDIPEPAWPILAAGVVLVALLLWRYRSSLRLNHPAVIYWALPLVAIGLGFVALAAGLVAAGLLMRLPLPLRPGAVGRSSMVGWLLVLSLCWILVVTASGWAGGAAFVPSLKLAIRYVLDYPDVYYRVVRPWLETIPVTTIALGALTIPALRAALRSGAQGADAPAEALRYLFATLVLMVLVASVLRQPDTITRYTYFLYPLLLVLAAAGLQQVSAQLSAHAGARVAIVVCSIAALFLVTEEFGVRHLLHINETPYRFRTAYSTVRGTHYYPRWDFRGAAEFVNERLGPKDTVVVFDQPLPHYLVRTTGIFLREGTSLHYMVATCDDSVDRWSNAPLLDEDDELEELIASTRGKVWLLARTAKFGWRDPFEDALETRPGAVPVFTSQDGHLVVYRIAPAGSSD